jgi:hypothetical protein
VLDAKSVGNISRDEHIIRRLEMKRLIGTSAAFAIVVVMLLPVAVSGESNSSRLNRERTVIGREVLEVQSTNWPSILPYYTDDIAYRDPNVTIEGIDMMSQFLGRLFANSPNLITTVEEESCIGDIYMATWTMVGSFAGVPFEAPGMSIVKFRPKSTKVYYQRDYYTEGDIMINIPGLAEPMAAFRTYYLCAVDPGFSCPF